MRTSEPPHIRHGIKRPGIKKGRGASTNDGSRFNTTQVEPVEDGWANPGDTVSRHETEIQPVHTEVFKDITKRLITTNKSPDIGFDQSINPYKGCEHGCVYCYARPTHAFLDLSPGLDFETKIFYKTEPRLHLLKELSRRGYQCRVIAMGTNTDPYQPVEKRLQVTQEILRTLLELRHPVSIVTKSTLVLRDIEILAAMAKLGLVNVHISVTTLDNGLKTKLEPRTAGPAARLKTIAQLNEHGVPTGAMVAPIIPFINDHEIEDIVSACAQHDAQAVSYVLLRLPLEVKPLFETWLTDHYPLKAERVMAAVRDTRGGRSYDATWHQRMVGKGAIAQLIQQRFARAARSCGLGESKMKPVRTDLFQPPGKPEDQQLALF